MVDVVLGIYDLSKITEFIINKILQVQASKGGAPPNTVVVDSDNCSGLFKLKFKFKFNHVVRIPPFVSKKVHISHRLTPLSGVVKGQWSLYLIYLLVPTKGLARPYVPPPSLVWIRWLPCVL